MRREEIDLVVIGQPMHMSTVFVNGPNYGSNLGKNALSANAQMEYSIVTLDRKLPDTPMRRSYSTMCGDYSFLQDEQRRLYHQGKTKIHAVLRPTVDSFVLIQENISPRSHFICGIRALAEEYYATCGHA